MPMVIPAVVAFAAAGGTVAGVAAALTGAAGFATFATVAGGFMASAGMLTGNKTLTKIGSVLGIAGAVTSLASSLASGASEAASSAAGEAATDAATEAVTDAATESATEALKSEMASTAVGETIGQAGGETLAKVGGEGVAQLNSQSLGTFGADAASSTATADLGSMLKLDPNGFGGTPNLMDQVRMQATPTDLGSFQTGVGAHNVGDALTTAGQQIANRSALDSILDKINGAGKWIKDNKELVQVGGQMLAGGMQAYQQGQQFDQQLNLLNERRRRLNQPVVLGIQSPQLKPIGG